MNPREFQERLMGLDPEADEFPLHIDDLILAVPETQHKDLVPPMFEYIEANPEFYNDAPGTIVHFIEAYYPSYKMLLLESLARRPSQICVLMVNRILNSNLDPDERLEYKKTLEAVRDNLQAPVSVRTKAVRYLEYQQRRSQ